MAKNYFDNLPADKKQQVFSLLSTRDMLRVFKTNHANCVLGLDPDLWRYRYLDDFGVSVPDSSEVGPRQAYMQLYQAMQKEMQGWVDSIYEHKEIARKVCDELFLGDRETTNRLIRNMLVLLQKTGSPLFVKERMTRERSEVFITQEYKLFQLTTHLAITHSNISMRALLHRLSDDTRKQFIDLLGPHLLSCACAYWNVDIVKQLIDLGVDVNQVSRTQIMRGIYIYKPPLSMALSVLSNGVGFRFDIVNTVMKIVKQLIEAGADPDQNGLVVQGRGETFESFGYAATNSALNKLQSLHDDPIVGSEEQIAKLKEVLNVVLDASQLQQQWLQEHPGEGLLTPRPN